MANATLRYQTNAIFITNKPSINYYPVNPLILVILILTNAIFITKQTIYKLPSCTSFNPDYPDSDKCNFHHQTNHL
ncbi:hypothetical protein [Dolichospermum sp. UHCC 0315A]|uniref:hypothetical protein n=1 Tax=Dolichospermum sp. UHCC 0315A TaxID=1914871 RepID=UPI0011E75351|nr:hypothetical protein [Dolichospermum sp. UHCC 0315A]